MAWRISAFFSPGMRLTAARPRSRSTATLLSSFENSRLSPSVIAAMVTASKRRLGLDIGTADLLARYERWRRFDAVTMAAITDGLNRLFSNEFKSVAVLRDLGLAAVNRMPGLKKALMRHAMGTSGNLPKLVRGEPL